MKGTLSRIILSFLLFTSLLQAETERSQEFGNYIIYYNALPTEILQPDIARQYGISRSKFRGFITLSVQEKTGDTSKPINATIKADAVNLTGQQKTLSLRRVEEGPAIYYVDDFRIANEETLKFKLQIKPENSQKNLSINFTQQFFTN